MLIKDILNLVFSERQKDLQTTLSELQDLLGSVREEHWCGRINDVHQKPYWEQVGEIRTWFGGMGSLNDLL